MADHCESPREFFGAASMVAQNHISTTNAMVRLVKQQRFTPWKNADTRDASSPPFLQCFTQRRTLAPHERDRTMRPRTRKRPHERGQTRRPKLPFMRFCSRTYPSACSPKQWPSSRRSTVDSLRSLKLPTRAINVITSLSWNNQHSRPYCTHTKRPSPQTKKETRPC